MAGMKKLDIAPISICAVTTGQNDGKNAIKRAPIAKATTPVAISALLDLSRSTKAPAGGRRPVLVFGFWTTYRSSFAGGSLP